MSRDLESDCIPKTPEEVAEAKQLIRNLKRETELKNTEARAFFDLLRPEIRAFAELMEMTMRKHDPKKGDSYKTCCLEFLHIKLHEEFNEADTALEDWGSYDFEHLSENGIEKAKRASGELIDLANIAMMLYIRANEREVKLIVDNKSRGYLVHDKDDEYGIAIVARTAKEAKKIGAEHLDYDEWTDLRANWKKEAVVTDLPLGPVSLEEGLRRGLYSYVVGLQCEVCGKTANGCQMLNEMMVCPDCYDKIEQDA